MYIFNWSNCLDNYIHI